MNRSGNPYKRHRFPQAIIQYAVWLYHRFNLSHRDIEDRAVVYSLFNLQRHLASAASYRLRRARAFERWNQAVAA